MFTPPGLLQCLTVAMGGSVDTCRSTHTLTEPAGRILPSLWALLGTPFAAPGTGRGRGQELSVIPYLVPQGSRTGECGQHCSSLSSSLSSSLLLVSVCPRSCARGRSGCSARLSPAANTATSVPGSATTTCLFVPDDSWAVEGRSNSFS